MNTLLTEFCNNKDPALLTQMDDYTKRLLIAVSKYCLEKRLGSQEIANIIEDSIGKWEYTMIHKGSLLYRGSKMIPTEYNRATYYAPDINTANEYLPTNKEGYMNIYRVKKDIMLFKLDSLSNANKLLETLFPDKDIVYKACIKGKNRHECDDYTMYDIVKNIYSGIQIKKDLKPAVLKSLIRYSMTAKDIVFSNWLCGIGIKGYSAGTMRAALGAKFHAEVMLCEPGNMVELIEQIKMKKTKSKKILKKIADNYEEK